jgi:hypothetical protein
LSPRIVSPELCLHKEYRTFASNVCSIKRLFGDTRWHEQTTVQRVHVTSAHDLCEFVASHEHWAFNIPALRHRNCPDINQGSECVKANGWSM